MTDDAKIPPETEERQAIERLAHTHDGRILHRYLRRVLEAVFDTPDHSALLSHNGRRTLARDLMRTMAPGIEQSDGPDQPDSGPTILTGGQRPVAVDQRQHRGAGRRVTSDTFVAGWNDPNDPRGPAAP